MLIKKSITFLLLLFVSSLLCLGQSNKYILKIKDAKTNDAIENATIRFNKTYYISDNKGEANLAAEIIEDNSIIISYIGYKPYIGKLDLSKIVDGRIIISLVPEVNKLDVVSVTAVKRNSPKTSVSTKISSEELRKRKGENLADIVNIIPGLSSINTGATISKPVIQGMHSSRILIINNGVKHEGQQWGADHAPELDTKSASSIEVIKGAESIRYGAGAIGGVILMDESPLPFSDKWHYALSMFSNSNGLRFGSNANILGGINGLKFNFNAGTSSSADYKTADYFLNNTGTREYNFSLNSGYKYKRMNISLLYSYYHSNLGIFWGAHIGTLEELNERFKIGRPVHIADDTRKITNPRQAVNHQTVKLKAKFDLGKYGVIEGQYDFQNDKREEYEIRRNKLNERPALGLLLKSNNYNLTWRSDLSEYIKLTIGSTLSFQENINDNKTRAVPLIPNFASTSIGTYMIAKYIHRIVELEGGLRYDYKYINSKGYNRLGKAYGGDREFNNLTYSFAALFNISEKIRLQSNLGFAWRAPEVNELYSNGLHHGAGSFELGDDSLEAERGLKWINDFSYKSEFFSITLSAFIQKIGNYIYDSPSKMPNGEIETWVLVSGVYPVFRYKQVDAFFKGGDVHMSFMPVENIRYNVQGQWIRAENRETGGYFPYIPSDRYRHSIEWRKSYNSNDFSFSLEHLYVAKQYRFDPNVDFVKESPKAYNLININIYANLKIKENNLSIGFGINNLLNKLYKEYTNRFRYYAHEKGRDFTLNFKYTF